MKFNFFKFQLLWFSLE